MKYSKMLRLPILALSLQFCQEPSPRQPSPGPSHQVDTVQFRLGPSDYQEGVSKYLVYFRDLPTGDIKWLSTWSRTLKLTDSLVTISQQWESDSDIFVRETHSVNSLGDFAPRYHLSKRGSTNPRTTAFFFEKGQVRGDSTVTNNAKADFHMQLPFKALNWELDIETLAMLEYELGKEFLIPFYQPGATQQAQYYAYKVEAIDTLSHLGSLIPTWRVRHDYDSVNRAFFWVDQSNGKMLKMQERYGDLLKYKYLIMGEEGPLQDL